jgi:predicted dithiol-disulfide isomerase involved in polyketide biosynthesis
LTTRATKDLEVFVDYVCPFCLLVEPALQKVKTMRDVNIRIRPFELRPDPVPTLRPEDEYLPRVWAKSVYPMANRVGIDIKLPDISSQPRTEKAFTVLQLAEESGLAEEYSAAMFRAFFQENRDIGNDEVIADVAESVGLPRDEVLRAIKDAERIVAHRSEQKFYRNSLDIPAVPSFRIGDRITSGVPDVDDLIRFIDG